MKKILLLLFITCSVMLSSFAQDKALRGTAEYYLQEPDRYLDKSVTLYILSASKADVPAPEDYTAFFVHTTSPQSDGYKGGYIIVYVRNLRAKQFEKKFETGWIVNGKPRTSSISGKFMKSVDGKTYAVKMN